MGGNKISASEVSPKWVKSNRHREGRAKVSDYSGQLINAWTKILDERREEGKKKEGKNGVGKNIRVKELKRKQNFDSSLIINVKIPSVAEPTPSLFLIFLAQFSLLCSKANCSHVN